MVESASTPQHDEVAAEAEVVPEASAPPPLDDDADVVDAEIVESPDPAPHVWLPPSDYSEAGVPSLDYVRDRIEGRYSTAIGSTELAQAAADRERARRAAAEQTAAVTAEAQREAREQAVKEKLDEIRRSLGQSTP